MALGAIIGVFLNPYSDFLKNPDLVKPIKQKAAYECNWNDFEDLSFFVYDKETCKESCNFDEFEKFIINACTIYDKYSDLIAKDDIDEIILTDNNCHGNSYIDVITKSKLFYDKNNDNEYQKGNNKYDDGEKYDDINQNCHYDIPKVFFDINGNGILDLSSEDWGFRLKDFPDGLVDAYSDVYDLDPTWIPAEPFEDYYEETISPTIYRNVSYFYNFMEFLGTVFVRLLKMVIIPLIFTSIILGVSSIGSGRKLGRLGLKTLGYYVSTSLIAIMIGLALANAIRPGDNLESLSETPYDASQLQTDGGFSDIILRMIPTNPLSSLANGDILSIIFFAIIFGIGLNFISKKYSDSLRETIDSIYQVILKITQFVIKLIPIGVLGLMVKMVTHLGLESLQKLAWYVLTIGAGLSIHFFIVLPLILYLFTKRNPIVHYKAMSNAMLTAFSTSSSSATLPVTMKCVNENVKVSNQTSSFVLPMGATINMDGTALYECAGVLFIAQALGIPLDAGQQFIVVLTALLASIGAAGIPSAGLVMLFIVTDAVGLDSDLVAIWVGSMLAIDRPLDMFRTMVNITSDSVGAAVIAKSEGEKLYD